MLNVPGVQALESIAEWGKKDIGLLVWEKKKTSFDHDAANSKETDHFWTTPFEPRSRSRTGNERNTQVTVWKVKFVREAAGRT